MRQQRMAWCFTFALAAAVAMAGQRVQAQDENPTTPGAIPDPSTYQGSMQIQEQERQQEQQQQQQNQQMQQRLDQTYQPRSSGSGPRGHAGGGGHPVDWWSKPPLPPSRNLLLGRWRQAAPSAASAQASDPLAGVAALVGGAMAGGCKSMFGSGVVAFEPNALQWVAPDGHEEILNHVAYRANGPEVIVLSRDPGAIPALVFHFPTRDHAVVATFNCAMDRVGTRPPASLSGAPGPRGPTAASAPPPSGPANAVLAFQIGIASSVYVTPLAGARFWVTPDDPAPTLSGFGPAPTPLRQLVADCATATGCVRDFKATTTHTVAVVTSDGAGRAETRPLPAGYYYLIGYAPYQGRTVLWTRQVLLQAPRTTVTMDQTDGGLAP
jgi:hypothetical protein